MKKHDWTGSGQYSACVDCGLERKKEAACTFFYVAGKWKKIKTPECKVIFK